MKKTENQAPVVRFRPEINEGLDNYQVTDRQASGLTNKIKDITNKSYLQIIFSNVFTFFNILMLSIAVALLIIVGPKRVILNLGFLVIIFANILIGTIQECKSKHTIEKLKLLNIPKVTVIRNWEKVTILPEDIVLDDIVILSAGDQIPVDCIIMSDDMVEVNEALLTGESVPVKKGTRSSLYAGSYIVSGSCLALSEKVGNDTYIHSLEKKAKGFKKPKSRLMIAIRKIIRSMACISIPLAIVVFVNELLATYNIGGTASLRELFSDAVFYGGTTITYMIPAGMVLLASIAMATGVVKLAKKKTLTQDLYSVEALSRVDTLCLDKTGTLTDGSMTVENVIELEAEPDLDAIMSSYLMAFKNNNQTSEALIHKFGNIKFYKTKASIQFSSARKFSAVEFEDDFGSFALGAPEYLTQDKEILERVKGYSENGLRVLALVRLDGEITDEDNLPKVKSVVALITIRDGIRKEVPATMKWFRENDVDIRVISGDNVKTVAYIAKQCGIEDWNKYYDMSTLTENDNLEEIVMNTKVFGRVTPEQKAEIVDILRKNGRTVAMTGDGINDIVSMKKADCSIALANGAPATKNIANFVLLDSDFSNMKEAVFEGRRVVNNIQRSATLFVMKDWCWFFVTLFPLIFGIRHMIEPTIMTIVNVFITGLASFFIAFEPDKTRVKGNFYKNVQKRAILCGFYMFLPMLLAYIFSFCMCGLNLNTVSSFIDPLFGITSGIEYAQLISPSIVSVICICTTIAGFIIFFELCRPMTKYRVVLFSLVFILVFIILLAVPKFFVLNGSKYSTYLAEQGGDIFSIIRIICKDLFSFDIYKEFKLYQWLFIIGYVLVAYPLYLFTQKAGGWLLEKTLFSPREFKDE